MQQSSNTTICLSRKGDGIEEVDIKNKLYTCNNCGTKYSFGKSSSSLKMQYCGVLCEISDLGFFITGFTKTKLSKKPSDEVVSIPSDSTDYSIDIPDYEEEREREDDDDGRELIYV